MYTTLLKYFELFFVIVKEFYSKKYFNFFFKTGYALLQYFFKIVLVYSANGKYVLLRDFFIWFNYLFM